MTIPFSAIEPLKAQIEKRIALHESEALTCRNIAHEWELDPQEGRGTAIRALRVQADEHDAESEFLRELLASFVLREGEHGLYRCTICGAESDSELTVQCEHSALSVERIPLRVLREGEKEPYEVKATPHTPKREPGCIACGEANDGGFEVEDGPGPFCSLCWDALETHFQQAVGGASVVREGEKECSHQYWDLGRCIDCFKTANQIEEEKAVGGASVVREGEKECSHQYWDLGRCIDCFKTANQIEEEKAVGGASARSAEREKEQQATTYPENIMEQAIAYRLNDAQQEQCRIWAADDRLWTTQETVQFNLSTFARAILARSDRGLRGTEKE